jgi:hypothetical protein
LLALLRTFINGSPHMHTHTHTHTYTVAYEEQISISDTSDKLKSSTNFYGQLLAIHFKTSLCPNNQYSHCTVISGDKYQFRYEVGLVMIF